MGTVWHGHDELLTREVAIKEVPLPAGPERTILAERTRQEARAMARISHPNVAGVYDVVEVAGQPWIVLELVRSRTLGQRVAQDGPLSPRVVANIGLDVLQGLCAAHTAGIVHLDVKPDNVLLAHDGRVVLTDFGIAAMDGDASLTETGTLTGTMAFLAPERVTGDTCRQSDLWSLGATLFMAVEGRPPFGRDTAIHTLVAVLADPPDPFQRAGPLATVLAGLLDKNPATRLDAAGAREQLQRVADLWPLKDKPAATTLMHIPVAATSPFMPGIAAPSVRGSQPGSAKARRAAVGAAMAGLFGLLTAGVAWSTGSGHPHGLGHERPRSPHGREQIDAVATRRPTVQGAGRDLVREVAGSSRPAGPRP
ncbi:Protein kinase domain-containing protein [Nonomuraea solani]|uniref:non-specific serine/threonine protein kinase n=2 Tax=Nonomuraea solani TaxID=1144553 RepID=A0A1H6EYZ1_9ACTN|nr:Protein kinase domain-containing protein [Nonomuraea solani]